MENFENPADGIEFKDNVAARRDQVRADLDVQFSDAGSPAGATGKPLPFTFRVADYTRPQQDGGGIEFVDFPRRSPAARSRAPAVPCAAWGRLPKAWAVSA